MSVFDHLESLLNRLKRPKSLKINKANFQMDAFAQVAETFRTASKYLDKGGKAIVSRRRAAARAAAAPAP